MNSSKLAVLLIACAFADRASAAADVPYGFCDVVDCAWPHSFATRDGSAYDLVNPYDPFFRYVERSIGVQVGPQAGESLERLPGEQVDLFTGTVSLVRVDISLPGKAGLDLSIVRSYSSKIWGRADVPPEYEKLALLGEGVGRVPAAMNPLGLGWSIHMGRLHWSGVEFNPTYEAPDGNYRRFYSQSQGVWVSRDLWRLEYPCAQHDGTTGVCIWSDQGVRYEFGTDGNGAEMLSVSRIEEPLGNAITVSYRGDGAIDTIVDTYNRTLTFNYDDDGSGLRLNQISSASPRASYQYVYQSQPCDSCGANGSESRRFLHEARPPAGASEFYEYAMDVPVSRNRYALQRLTLPAGGVVTYEYASTPFFVGLTTVPFSVLQRRTVHAGPGDLAGRSWVYSFSAPPPGQSQIDPLDFSATTDLNVTSVLRPDGTTDSYEYYGFGYVTNKAEGGWTYLVGLPAASSRAGGTEVTRFGWRPSPSPVSTSQFYEPPTYDYFYGPGSCPWWFATGGTAVPGAWCYLTDPQVVTPVLDARRIELDTGVHVTYYADYDSANQAHTIWEHSLQAGFSDADKAWHSRKTCITYFSLARDGSGRTLNIVHGRPASSATCLGEACSCDGPDAVVASWSYGARGERRTITESGVLTSLDYDADGNLSAATNALGQTVQFLAYQHGVPTNVVFNGAAHETREVEWDGLISSITNVRGYTTRYGYDDAGRVKLVTPPEGALPTNIVYDDTPGNSAVTMTRGSYWQAVLPDGLGRVASTIDSAGVKTSRRFDGALGNESFASYPYDDSIGEVGDKIEVDGLGRLATRTKAYRPASGQCDVADGCTETVSYLGNCALTAVSRALNDTTWSTQCYRAYGDPRSGDLIAVADGNGHVWEYGRKADGALSTVTAPLAAGNRSYDYDSHRFPKSFTSGEDGGTAFSFDDIGRASWTTNARNETTEFTYDALNRPKTITRKDRTGVADPAQSVVQSFDEAGNLKSVSNGDGGTHTLTYDSLDRVTDQTWTWDFDGVQRTASTTYRYDSAGCLYYVRYPSGLELTQTCDSQNRVTSITAGGTPIVTTTSYHPAGAASYVGYGNGMSITTHLDDRGRVSSIDAGLFGMTYGYDGADNTVSFTNSLLSSDSRTMIYDGADQLAYAAGLGYGFATAYDYDALGNRKAVHSSFGDATYSYDDKNRLSTIAGDVHRPLDLEWGLGGQLKGANGFSYRFDGLGRRVQAAGSGDAVLFHYDAAGRVISETRGDGTRLRDYIYLNDQLVAVTGCITPGVTSCGELQWYHADALGSVVARTDTLGVPTATFNYDPWGNVLSVTGVPGDRQYNGRVFAGEVGFHDYGARMYWPEIGRFINADSYTGSVGTPPSLNRFSYVHNNPYKYTDPTGHYAEMCCRAVKGPLGTAGARHCYIRTGGSPEDTTSYWARWVTDKKPEVTKDLQPYWAAECHPIDPPPSEPAVCAAKSQFDSCLQTSMQDCKQRPYSMWTFNCVDCVDYAINACGGHYAGPWPKNLGFSPGYQRLPSYYQRNPETLECRP